MLYLHPLLWAWAFYSWPNVVGLSSVLGLRTAQACSAFAVNGAFTARERCAVYERAPMRRLPPQTGVNVIYLAEWKARHEAKARR